MRETRALNQIIKSKKTNKTERERENTEFSLANRNKRRKKKERKKRKRRGDERTFGSEAEETKRWMKGRKKKGLDVVWTDRRTATSGRATILLSVERERERAEQSRAEQSQRNQVGSTMREDL
mgnify:CR=1 FL=1